MSAYDDSNELPALGIGAQLQARNTEYNLDLSGRVTHMNEHGLITTFPVEVPAGTVLFSIIDLRQINATVRGLIRVESQEEAGELGGYRTYAEFVDLNQDERRKILKLMGRSPEELEHMYGRGGTSDDPGAQTQSFAPPMSTRPARGTEPRKPAAPVGSTIASVIWILLGVIFYSMVLLAVIAIFPQGRAAELAMWTKILHQIEHTWPGFAHLFGTK